MKVKLGDIAVLINGDRGKNYPAQDEISSSGDIMFVNAGHLNGRRICFDGMNYISYEKYQSLNSGKFVAGDILYCLRGSLGKKALVFKPSFGAVASSLVIIRPNNAVVNSEYLMFALDSPNIQEQLSKANNGSSQPNLSAASVREYRIDLPSLSEQSHITKLFSKAQSLINIYRQQLHSLDTLIKARFVEMFGDPSINPKDYPIRSMSNIAEYWNGLTYKPEDVSEEGTVVLRSSNIQNMQLDFADTIRVSCNIGSKKYVKENDILMCSRNGSAKLVGKVALIQGLNEAMSFGAFMMLIRSEYYPYLMTYFQLPAFRSQITTGATTTINQITGSMMDKVMLPVPDKATMNEFAAFVSQVDKSKVAVQAALEKAQLLGDSLMQQYFG